jgi:RNA recognition motif-containing protein
MPKTELFVGNLGKEISQKDIEEVFDKYGKILRCDVKSKEFGASFCFLEFKDERDAEVNNKNKIINFLNLLLLIFYIISLFIILIFSVNSK